MSYNVFHDATWCDVGCFCKRTHLGSSKKTHLGSSERFLISKHANQSTLTVVLTIKTTQRARELG